MTSFSSRSYAGSADLDRLIDFAQTATGARWPRSTYMKAGDIVWMLFTPGFDPYANIQLWFDRDGLAAYAWFEPPLHVDFDIRPGASPDDLLADEILRWAEERRRNLGRLGKETIPKAYAMLGENTISTKALDSEPSRISLLTRNGYMRTERFHVLYSRSLVDAPIAQPELDAGLRLRHATDADLDARVDVHRDAWSVWGRSKVSIETYRQLRSAPLYDPELDVVLEDAAGKFLSYCIGWLDPANGIGHFEPVGCRPDFTGRGYARAVTIEGLRRMRARGLHAALVGTESVNQRARALYPSCGFVEVDRAHYYVKDLHDAEPPPSSNEGF
ncbi:MAG TPA: GNAT family N-acetyltransferase [Candidatus Acidoferrales bacterium]|nr:GNAT family N-acetyltransferase [Candidatus Acidoferrales bacterium]